MRARLAILLGAAGLALGGCAYGYDGYGSYGGLGVGVGYGSGYGYGYPYGGYGYGAGYGYPYGGYYGGYYGSPYFGWYNDYYYPGTGYYVYDRYRNRRVMTDAERQYWSKRTAQAVANHIRGTTTTTTVRTRELKPNWSGFNTRRDTAAANRQVAREQRQAVREERRSKRNND